MNPILETIVKLIASSAILTAFYFALFRGKASYRASRVYLIAIPLLSILFSLASIEGGGRFLSFSSLFSGKMEAETETISPRAAEVAVAEVTTVEAGTVVATPAVHETSLPFEEEATAAMASVVQNRAVSAAPAPERIVSVVIYLAVIAMFAGVLVRQTAMLRRIRRGAERQVVPGGTIYFSRDVQSAFSVMRSIYVGSGIPACKLSIIISHERQHIASRHYVDLAVMELFTLLMWFNPFVWVVRRELRSVHEFEADRATLAGGVGMRDYMLAILEETAGVIPVVANGLKSSMIKKRFVKMKTETKISLRALRATLTLPFAAASMLFFVLTPSALEAEPVVAVEAAVPAPDVTPAHAATPQEAAPVEPDPEVRDAILPQEKNDDPVEVVEVTTESQGPEVGGLLLTEDPTAVSSDLPTHRAPAETLFAEPGAQEPDVTTAGPDVPRNFKLMVRNKKGRAISDSDVRFQVQGTSGSVAPDRFGNRYFQVTDADTIIVLAGMNIYEIPTAGLDSLQIVMSGKNKVQGYIRPGRDNEMINVGYGTISQRNNTSSVSSLDMKGASTYTDLKSYMQGRVAGIVFNGDQLVIRGANSINSSIEALIVVDGMAMSSFAAVNELINPRDIKSISVLKDAGSAAMYGVRGANGVVLITTKTGKDEEEKRR